jgi:anti-sigma factor RsiW
MSTCASVRPHLGAFVDGELRGAARMRVFRHVQMCEDCASQLEDLNRLGDLLREAARERPADHAELNGLAATIVSRTNAERQQSWVERVHRATEDWHWLLIGSGSLAATFAVTFIVSAMLAFGPKPQRSDSLAAIVVDLTPLTDSQVMTSDYLFAEVLRSGSDANALTVQLDNGSPRASMEDLVLVSNSPTNAQVVEALFDVANHGRTGYQQSDMSRQAAANLSERVTSTMIESGSPMSENYRVKRLLLSTSVKVVYDSGSGS